MQSVSYRHLVSSSAYCRKKSSNLLRRSFLAIVVRSLWMGNTKNWPSFSFLKILYAFIAILLIIILILLSNKYFSYSKHYLS